MRNIILLTFLALFFGCQKQEVNVFDFDNKHDSIFTLTSNKINFDELLIPLKLDIKEDILIVRESSRIPQDRPFIHYIKLPDLKYIQAKGKMGYGPLEITDVDKYDPGFNDSIIWINSVIDKTLSQFSLHNNFPLPEVKLKLPNTMQVANYVLLGSDSTYICMITTDAYNFVEFDKRGNRTNGFGLKEPIKRLANDGSSYLNNYLISRINAGKFVKDPYSQLFVQSSLYRDRLSLFDNESKEVLYIHGPRLEIPEFEITGSGNNTGIAFSAELDYAHRDVTFGPKYIYDLYGGFSEIDYRRDGIMAKTVYVITKKGEVLYKLDLDRSVINIAVDETLGKIYGITTDENPGIAVFDIPQELLNLLAN